MPTVEFVGQSAEDGTARPANTSRLLNLYREPIQDGGLSRFILRAVPGRTEIADTGGAFLRKMAWVDGKVYVARNGTLYFVSNTGSITDLGSIADDEETTMAGNGGLVTVASGGNYYVWDGTSISQPTGAAFSSFGSVETVSNYTVLTEKGGQRFQWTDLGDPETFDALNFASTDSRDDNNIRGMFIGGLYWIFKERSTEIWYETGLANDEAFARMNGGVIDKGIYAYNLACKARESAFFVGSDGVCYLTTGGVPQPVSSRAVETAIEEGSPTHCHYHEQYGHKFCVLRFSDRPSWVLDIATMEWHERASGRLFEAWDAVDAVEADDKQFWVGSLGGKISRLTNAAQDLGDTLYRRAVSRTLRVDSNRFIGSEFEIYGAYGYAAASDDTLDLVDTGGGSVLAIGDGVYPLGETQGTEPFLMVSFSRDSGARYSKERFLPMGIEGEYDKRAVTRRLGQFRQMTARVDITHEFNIPIYADARLELA